MNHAVYRLVGSLPEGVEIELRVDFDQKGAQVNELPEYGVVRGVLPVDPAHYVGSLFRVLVSSHVLPHEAPVSGPIRRGEGATHDTRRAMDDFSIPLRTSAMK